MNCDRFYSVKLKLQERVLVLNQHRIGEHPSTVGNVFNLLINVYN